MKRGGSSSLHQSAAMEKKRRHQMKELYFKLASLLQLQSYARMTLIALLDQATVSVKQLKERVERLKGRKEVLENELRVESSNKQNIQVVKVSEIDSSLEVNLIFKGNNKKVELFEVLSIIQQCGAEIRSCNFSSMDRHTHYTIHAQAFQTRLGFDSLLIESRLKQLIS